MDSKSCPALDNAALIIPGGEKLLSALFGVIKPSFRGKALNLNPAHSICTSWILANTSLSLHVLSTDKFHIKNLKADLQKIDDSSRVHFDYGTPGSLPYADDYFDLAYSIGQPFMPLYNIGEIAEMYRVTAPDGYFALAGPVTMENTLPDYFKNVNAVYSGYTFCTPALSAIRFSNHGYHILRAEYVENSWDLLSNWVLTAPDNVVPDIFRDAVIKDGGKWLSLGIILLRKPSKPVWAI